MPHRLPVEQVALRGDAELRIITYDVKILFCLKFSIADDPFRQIPH